MSWKPSWTPFWRALRASVALVAIVLMLGIGALVLRVHREIGAMSSDARATLKHSNEGTAAGVDLIKAAKPVVDAAKPVVDNAATFVASGSRELDAKSRELDVQVENYRRLLSLNQRQFNTTFDLLNGNKHSSYCPLGSTPNGFSSEGTPYCSIPGALPELTVAIHNFGLAGDEFRKAGMTVNEKVLPSTLRILASVEDLMKQPEWKLIAPEVLAMVKHWRETGANIKDITADLKKMADDAVSPKKKGLWLSLLGIVGRMIVGPGIQGLVQR